MTAIYLGRPAGPRLRDLSLAEESALDAWLSHALVSPPRRGDALPVGYTRALAALAKRRGIEFRFNGDLMRVRGSVALGKNLPGCVGGSHRKVKATDSRAELGSAGRKVEPYNEHAWRDTL